MQFHASANPNIHPFDILRMSSAGKKRSFDKKNGKIMRFS